VAWLARPLPTLLRVAVFASCLPEILSGNVFWLLGVMTVLGIARGAPWCVAAFTKVLPCLGPVWFLARGQWRALAGFVGTALALMAVSAIVSPGEWQAWFDFLRESAGDSSGKVYLTPVAITFPLAVRFPLALVLAAWAARTDRPWLLPVAMVLASPVVGWGTFAMLAAIPRLRGLGRPTTPTGPTAVVGSAVV
jgi:hypothetical protein